MGWPKTDEWMATGQRGDALLGISRRLSTARDRQEFAAIVTTTVRRLFAADGITFVVRNADHCRYLDENAIAPLWKNREFPMDHCVAGWSMLNRRIACVPDIFSDPRIVGDHYRDTFVKSMIMVPLGLSQSVAAIGGYWSYKRLFEDSDIDLAEAISSLFSKSFQRVAAL